MKRLVVGLALALLLSGCGGDDGTAVADDPTPTVEPTVTPTPTPTPTEDPTEDPYPDFEPTDYSYLLAVSCFCPDAGTPIAVTVVGDEVTQAVLAQDGTGRGGGKKGDPAADYLRLTIDDIIDEANDATADGAELVTVEWPADQDHPSSVYIDQSADMADEEVGYTISDVVVS